MLLAAVAVVTGAWAPSFVAHHYADGPGGAEVNRARIDQGWRFMVDAVRESRHALLGDDAAALQHAQRIWARPSGRAEAVDLVYQDGPSPSRCRPAHTAPRAEVRSRRRARASAGSCWAASAEARVR